MSLSSSFHLDGESTTSTGAATTETTSASTSASATSEKYPCFVKIRKSLEKKKFVELPTTSEGCLLAGPLISRFPHAVGLRYLDTTKGAWCGIRMDEVRGMSPPPGGWAGRDYIVVTKGLCWKLFQFAWLGFWVVTCWIPPFVLNIRFCCSMFGVQKPNQTHGLRNFEEQVQSNLIH